MTKEMFDRLNEQVQADNQTVGKALDQARSGEPEFPGPIDTKTACFSDALIALQDDTVSAALKNEYLKTVIERIDYFRPASVREHRDGSEPKARGGWYTLPFELDIKLRI